MSANTNSGESILQATIDHKDYIMIHEAQITHIKSLLERASKLEQPRLKSSFPKILTSTGIFLLGFGITNLLGMWLGLIESKINYSTIILGFFVLLGGYIVLAEYLYEENKEKNYKSYTDEVSKIIAHLINN